MIPQRRVLAIAAVAGLSGLALAGCQLIAPNTPERTASAIEDCVAAQAWTLDVSTLQASVAAVLADAGTSATVTAEGTQTLRYDAASGDIDVDSDLTIAETRGKQVVTLTAKGASTGRAYFTDDVAIPRDWDESALAISETATDDGKPLDPVPFSVPHSWVDDTVGLVTTCGDDTLTLVARNTPKTWVFHSAGWAPPPTDTPAPTDTATSAG